MTVNLEITPQPSEEERAAIEAALVEEAQEGRSSVWADSILPRRDDEPDP
jgi:hypothetical protein